MRAGSLVGAAAGIAGVTVLARAVGFGRTAVLSRTLGASCVGDTYQAVNALPNVVFEVVAGGALAAVVVPLLAGAVAAGDHESAGRTTSALLTWTVVVLLPVALLGVLVAPALVRALLGTDPSCGEAALRAGTRMLRVFMPQVLLYGVGIVLAGVLQAHRRFLGPALAPLLSSVVVVTAYLLYAARGAAPLPDLPRSQELVLSVGTTLGVAALSLGLLVPLRRTGLHLRPTWHFPPGTAARAGALAASGLAGLLAQQVALLVALHLAANDREGSVVVLTVATAVFLLPWSVLAVPVATSAFPRLAAAADLGDEQEYAVVAGRSLRVVLLASALGWAVLQACAPLLGRLLVLGAPGAGDPAALSAAVSAFLPGLVGYGLLALLGRALLARGDTRTPAAATAGGWLVVAVADLLLVGGTDLPRVVALGLGNSIGLSVGGALLLVSVRRAVPAALRGVGRAAAAALAALLASGLVLLLPAPDSTSVVVTLAALVGLAALSAAVFALVVTLVDRSTWQVVRG